MVALRCYAPRTLPRLSLLTTTHLAAPNITLVARRSGDAFYVVEKIAVESREQGVELRGGFEVRFVKSCLWKSIIEKKTKEETKKWVGSYLGAWREKVRDSGSRGCQCTTVIRLAHRCCFLVANTVRFLVIVRR